MASRAFCKSPDGMYDKHLVGGAIDRRRAAGPAIHVGRLPRKRGRGAQMRTRDLLVQFPVAETVVRQVEIGAGKPGGICDAASARFERSQAVAYPLADLGRIIAIPDDAAHEQRVSQQGAAVILVQFGKLVQRRRGFVQAVQPLIGLGQVLETVDAARFQRQRLPVKFNRFLKSLLLHQQAAEVDQRIHMARVVLQGKPELLFGMMHAGRCRTGV